MMGYPEPSFILACRAPQGTNNQNQKVQIRNFSSISAWLEKGKELFTSEIDLGILRILDLSCVGGELTGGHRYLEGVWMESLC
jgi:hypothetical protein